MLDEDYQTSDKRIKEDDNIINLFLDIWHNFEAGMIIDNPYPYSISLYAYINQNNKQHRIYGLLAGLNNQPLSLYLFRGRDPPLLDLQF